jgi:peptidyl-prolyl cis-trans isomerase C
MAVCGVLFGSVLRRLVDRVRRDPALHFLLLGAALFAAYAWFGGNRADRRIVVSAQSVEALRLDHLRRTGALPDADAERALIERYVDDEVLYREALSLGLDRGDVIIRRRLIQSMEFLLEDTGSVEEPSLAELEAHLRLYRERYESPERFVLAHVFVDPGRRGGGTERDALELRRRLLAGTDPELLGDPFIHGTRLGPRSEREIAALLGVDFAARVAALPAGEWSEPLASAFGLHLVRLEERLPARLPALDEVRDRVRRDWRAERRAEGQREGRERLRRAYDVRYDTAPAEPADTLAVAR